MKYQPVIGIEVHAQLKTKSKAFCGCSIDFGAEPNSNTCPVCLALPGALPVLNKRVVEFAIMAGLAMNCEIQETSVFARKNYFYPDLPKAYQISQFDLPICKNGFLKIGVQGADPLDKKDLSTDAGAQTPGMKTIRINRIHIEEDAGKLVHLGSNAIAGSTGSLSDLNRAGTPLIEIVTEPDIYSAEDAKIYMETLTQILKFLGICDGNLEEGSLRADANISLRPIGSTELGTKTEVKNLNSFRSVERAIELEIKRQTEILENGGKIKQETRHYDEKKENTISLRSKEESHDYRYFPEPDLLPLKITAEMVESIRQNLPELPAIKIKRYQEFGLTEFEISVLMSDIFMNQFFENCLNLKSQISPKEIVKWLIGDFNFLMKEAKLNYEKSPINPKNLIQLLVYLQEGKISGKMAKDVLIQMFKEGKTAEEIIKTSGAQQISDSNELKTIVEKVISENQDVFNKIKDGKLSSVNFLMGLVMKETRGQAKPDLVKELILNLAK